MLLSKSAQFFAMPPHYDRYFTCVAYYEASSFNFPFFFLCVVNSFVELTNYLLGLPGIEYVLSQKICQDPLERFLASRE